MGVGGKRKYNEVKHPGCGYYMVLVGSVFPGLIIFCPERRSQVNFGDLDKEPLMFAACFLPVVTLGLPWLLFLRFMGLIVPWEFGRPQWASGVC